LLYDERALDQQPHDTQRQRVERSIKREQRGQISHVTHRAIVALLACFTPLEDLIVPQYAPR